MLRHKNLSRVDLDGVKHFKIMRVLVFLNSGVYLLKFS